MTGRRQGGVLNRFGGGGQDAASARGANPGTVTLFPANGAGNKVAVPGLRRIAAQFPHCYFFFTLGRLGSPKLPPRSDRDSRSILPTRLATVSCRGLLARMATPVTLPFSLRTQTSMFSLAPPLLMPTMRLHSGALSWLRTLSRSAGA